MFFINYIMKRQFDDINQVNDIKEEEEEEFKFKEDDGKEEEFIYEFHEQPNNSESKENEIFIDWNISNYKKYNPHFIREYKKYSNEYFGLWSLQYICLNLLDEIMNYIKYLYINTDIHLILHINPDYRLWDKSYLYYDFCVHRQDLIIYLMQKVQNRSGGYLNIKDKLIFNNGIWSPNKEIGYGKVINGECIKLMQLTILDTNVSLLDKIRWLQDRT